MGHGQPASRMQGAGMTVLRRVLQRPGGIALSYLLFGVLWIVVTDLVGWFLIEDPQSITVFQTVKGWLFVGGSTLLLFALVWYGTSTLQQTNDRLDRALRQSSILHRLLRHDLRNTCNVIAGHVQLLEGSVPPDREESLAAIDEETCRLVELGAKSHYLRDVLLQDETPRPCDLGDLLDGVVEGARRRYPDAAIEAESVPHGTRRTDDRLHRALAELIENAIEHNDRSRPRVTVAATSLDDGGIEVSVGDDGPGLPAMERAMLEADLESPMLHSDGLGLWIARTIVTQLGGTFRIEDHEPRGTIVNLSLPDGSSRGGRSAQLVR